MKKYVIAIVLTLSLVAGLLISSPATLASAKAEEKSDVNKVSVTAPSLNSCSKKGVQFQKVSAVDKSKIVDLIAKLGNCFNADNNLADSIFNKYIKTKSEGTTPNDCKPQEKPNTPVETPAPETPAPETPAPETPAPETPAPETPAPETPAPQPQPAPQPAPNPPVEKPEVPQTQAGLKAEQSRMLELVNQERTKAGLKPLAWDGELARVADFKAQDMVQNNYFSHTSPTYGSPFDMMKNFGIKYRTAGENLAGYNNVDKAHAGLMNSDGHRKNILNSNFTHIGIGVQKSPRYGYVFVQMFIGK